MEKQADVIARHSFSACSRAADSLEETEKDGPGVKYPGSRIIALRPCSGDPEFIEGSLFSFAFPCCRTVAAGLMPARGIQLPAYSGGTAWDSHPLRETAGQSR